MNPLDQSDDAGDREPRPLPLSGKTGGGNPAWEQPVHFPEWQALLALEPLDPQARARFAHAIIRYLGHCKAAHERASIGGAKRYLDTALSARRPGAVDRQALHWFFVAHQGRGVPGWDRQTRDPARAPTLIRHAPARVRRGHPHGAGPAWARERRDDPDLYARDATAGHRGALAPGWTGRAGPLSQSGIQERSGRGNSQAARPRKVFSWLPGFGIDRTLQVLGFLDS